MADVKLAFTGNAESAERVIAGLERKVAGLEGKVAGLGKRSKQSLGDMTGAAQSALHSVAGLAFGYAGVGAAVGTLVTKHLELQKAAEASARAQDKANRQFRVRTGAFDMNDKTISAKMFAAAGAAGVGTDEARALAGSLHEKGGFDVKTTLEGLPAAMKAFEATKAAKGGNLEMNDFSDASGDLLEKSGRAKTAANMAIANREVYAMTAGSEIDVNQLDTMQELLKNANSGKGAARKGAALGQMGLKFSDVDLEGETLIEALQKMQGGLQKVAPERRSPLLQELTGDADLAKNMLGALENLDENLGNFDKAVEQVTQGKEAGAQRAANEEARAQKARGVDYEDIPQAMKAVRRARGVSETAIEAADLFEGAWNLIPGEKQATAELVANAPAGSFEGDARNYIEAQRKGQDEMLAVLREIRDRGKGVPARRPGREE